MPQVNIVWQAGYRIILPDKFRVAQEQRVLQVQVVLIFGTSGTSGTFARQYFASVRLVVAGAK